MDPTDPERYDRLHELFAATCDLEPRPRTVILDRECAGDPTLRQEVDAMLDQDAASRAFLDAPALGENFDLRDSATRAAPDASLAGQRIGRYHLRRLIASGGMGSVYEAVQEKPHRIVAVKVMRRGIASKSALRRFEYESQILARLRHPGIAQVYEAGTHDNGSGGVPYFAMEYIPNARPITEYARTKSLASRQRLELFVKVCEAVHHGHQKGIIHRDLKPANILVDSAGQPRIIDFGVARATDSDMAVTTLQTNVGQLIGTLQYMSPEQCEADPHDLDTRSDVYALGVVLYELLCEQLPYDVTHVPVPEAIRLVREESPSRPSTHNKALRGDLETILIKNLEKERERRYQSAAELASDITRYLRHEPIVARPPSALYQLRKFARRNRGLVAGAVAVVLVLAGGVAVSTLLYLRAETRRAEAETVTNLLQEMLSSADPLEARGTDYTVRQLLDDFTRGLGDQLSGQPEVEATLRTTIALAYDNLGHGGEAAKQLKTALEIRRRALGPAHPLTVHSLVSYARQLQSNGDHATPLAMYEQALMIQRRRFGDEHPEVARTLGFLAHLKRHRREYDEALRLFDEALSMYRRLEGDEHQGTRTTMRNKAVLHRYRREYALAEVLLREVVEIELRVLGEDHPAIAASMIRLAYALHKQHKYDEAERSYQEAINLRRRFLGETHPSTLHTVIGLVRMYRDAGRYAEAESLCRETIEIRRRAFGNDHRKTLLARYHFARISMEQGDLDQAESILREAAEGQRRVIGEGHRETLWSMYRLAQVLSRQGLYAEAEEIFRGMFEIEQRKFGDDPEEGLKLKPRVAALLAEVMSVYGWMLLTCDDVDFRDADRALVVARAAVDLVPDYCFALNTLGVAQYRAGRHEEALSNLVEAEIQFESADEDPQPSNWAFMAMAHEQVGQHQEAIEAMARLYELMEEPAHTESVENQAFLREARAVIDHE